MSKNRLNHVSYWSEWINILHSVLFWYVFGKKINLDFNLLVLVGLLKLFIIFAVKNLTQQKTTMLTLYLAWGVRKRPPPQISLAATLNSKLIIAALTSYTECPRTGHIVASPNWSPILNACKQ